MTSDQMVIAGFSAVYTLLLGAVGWVWRRTVSEQDRLRSDVEQLAERTTRQEERTARLLEFEVTVTQKLDRVLAELGDIRERLARWEAQQQPNR